MNFEATIANADVPQRMASPPAVLILRPAKPNADDYIPALKMGEPIMRYAEPRVALVAVEPSSTSESWLSARSHPLPSSHATSSTAASPSDEGGYTADDEGSDTSSSSSSSSSTCMGCAICCGGAATAEDPHERVDYETVSDRDAWARHRWSAGRLVACRGCSEPNCILLGDEDCRCSGACACHPVDDEVARYRLDAGTEPLDPLPPPPATHGPGLWRELMDEDLFDDDADADEYCGCLGPNEALQRPEQCNCAWQCPCHLGVEQTLSSSSASEQAGQQPEKDDFTEDFEEEGWVLLKPEQQWP